MTDDARDRNRIAHDLEEGAFQNVVWIPFDHATLKHDVNPRLVNQHIDAVFVDGRLDRIEWEHEGRRGERLLEVVPASSVGRLSRVISRD